MLDPFCGCGTTIHAAQKLNRRWIGIDVTHLAIALVERRLKEAFPRHSLTRSMACRRTSAGARNLAERDKHQFQMWIAASIGAQPYKGGKKGMDRGIDGYLTSATPKRNRSSPSCLSRAAALSRVTSVI